jgi:hypothetical protein
MPYPVIVATRHNIWVLPDETQWENWKRTRKLEKL